VRESIIFKTGRYDKIRDEDIEANLIIKINIYLTILINLFVLLFVTYVYGEDPCFR